ncbi:unnamed protein product [Lactuca saligna]|uniref:Uncharacterized protein n=1 Tax=Lactuca saligna TaxID=75948 RepID=A0AA36E5G4_LACSI|nr:unnamed protein product [Lactuca saligna]
MLNGDPHYPVGIPADPIVFGKRIPVGNRAGDGIDFHIRGRGRDYQNPSQTRPVAIPTRLAIPPSADVAAVRVVAVIDGAPATVTIHHRGGCHRKAPPAGIQPHVTVVVRHQGVAEFVLQ